MTKTKPLTPYKFFKQWAGYSYDPQKETPEQGRRRCARALAKAEQWAQEHNYQYNWDYDGMDSTEWIADDENGGKNHEPWSTWQCLMIDPHDEVKQSLCGIDFGRDGQPWDDPYKRVVEAELAHEEMHEMEKRTYEPHQ